MDLRPMIEPMVLRLAACLATAGAIVAMVMGLAGERETLHAVTAMVDVQPAITASILTRP